MKKKAETSELIAAHQELQSIQKVAERFGMCAQSVHERLKKAEYDNWKTRKWTMDDDAMLRDRYTGYSEKGAVEQLALIMGRTEASVHVRASRLGMTDRTTSNGWAKGNQNIKTLIATKGHPKGMAGKQHSTATRSNLSAIGKGRWDKMSTTQRDDILGQQIKGRMIAEGQRDHEPADAKKTWKAGWRTIGPHKKYFRSLWEANYGRYLQWLVEQKVILGWEHEPKTFWFDGIRRGVCSYKPDFRVVERNGDYAWHEVKGWMDDRSRVALDRFAKFFPHEKMVLIDKRAYYAIRAKVMGMIEDWE